MDSHYAQEFMEARARTVRLGLDSPSVMLVITTDCVDIHALTPILQRHVGNYLPEQIAGNAFRINYDLVPGLLDDTGIPFTLTFGWIDDGGSGLYKHDEAFLKALVGGGPSRFYTDGFPLHCWLTSPAFEVLDVTLPTMIGVVKKDERLIGNILYQAEGSRDRNLVYHPTVLGEGFLLKSGLAVLPE